MAPCVLEFLRAARHDLSPGSALRCVMRMFPGRKHAHPALKRMSAPRLQPTSSPGKIAVLMMMQTASVTSDRTAAALR